MEEIILKIENLSKSFGENTVLKDINFDIKKGEIIGLVGENGAGKSTLMKIIFGMSVIEETGGYKGNIFFKGEKVKFKNSMDALNTGIGMVHQEFSLIPGFKIYENIVLNRESLNSNFLKDIFGERVELLNEESNKLRAVNALKHLDLETNIETLVKDLPVGYMQFVEIAREIERENTKLLVLDEPTAVLTEEEAKVLLNTMKKLSHEGIAIIFITHRLNEILEVSDRVVVLRDGIMMKQLKTSETSVDEITELMIGRKIENSNTMEAPREFSLNIMEIKNLYVHMTGEKIKNLNLNIKKGEILGIGGMAGQGKIAIGNGVMGLKETSGEIIYKNEKLPLNNPLAPLSKEIFFVSEDRKEVGLILDETINHNITYPAIYLKKQFMKKRLGGLYKTIDEKEIKINSDFYIDSLGIKSMGGNQKVGELSGGNQQKVALAKAFTMNPTLLFVSEPTRGIDVGAKKIVLDTLKKYNRENNMTIVITSSELEELRQVCDRIAIINEGRVAGILSPKDDLKEFGKLMVGVKEEISNE
ncbi:simple sugar transport system ATP-binding protein [Cetobacterium ceti]|uniref:Simple sugar transport system ATP-binding protein n=1 Tax=Cetobacterium ceti TaxID=180163 RepID=A0A1T4MG52_9FUSO|nr:sugar ABC transporter ATP-binding protein [Cetobacterium ceti]SJZ66009.1 simple sugar transport system ATP-binding protein [Cetobacterium ceti]